MILTKIFKFNDEKQGEKEMCEFLKNKEYVNHTVNFHDGVLKSYMYIVLIYKNKNN